jgi:hypothetical protein
MFNRQTIDDIGNHESICRCTTNITNLCMHCFGSGHAVRNCRFEDIHRDPNEFITTGGGGGGGNNKTNNNNMGHRCVIHEHNHSLGGKVGRCVGDSPNQISIIYGNTKAHETRYIN